MCSTVRKRFPWLSITDWSKTMYCYCTIIFVLCFNPQKETGSFLAVWSKFYTWRTTCLQICIVHFPHPLNTNEISFPLCSCGDYFLPHQLQASVFVFVFFQLGKYKQKLQWDAGGIKVIRDFNHKGKLFRLYTVNVIVQCVKSSKDSQCNIQIQNTTSAHRMIKLYQSFCWNIMIAL